MQTMRERVEKLMGGFKVQLFLKQLAPLNVFSIQDEVTKVQSNLQLDLNLEKGRIKEEASIISLDCFATAPARFLSFLGYWSAPASQ